jgi:hypothetical protein
MPWEVLLQGIGSALVLLAFAILPSSSLLAAGGAGILWGVGLGVCLGTHLMSASLAITSLILFFWLGRNVGWRKVGVFAGVGTLAAALLLAPYGLALLHRGGGESASGHHWGDWRNLWWILVKTPIYLSVWQMKYFLFPQAKVFFARTGKILTALYYADPFGWLAKVFVWAASAVVLFRWAKGRERSLVLVFAALGLVVHGLLLQYQNLAVYPHYFLPFWWAPFLLLAAWARRKAVAWLLAWLIAVNLLFTFQLQGFLKENLGTRGDYYGSLFREQRRFFTSVCTGVPGDVAKLDLSAVRLRAFTAEYFFRHLPECAAKELVPSEKPLAGKRVVVQYEPGDSAALRWEVAP